MGEVVLPASSCPSLLRFSSRFHACAISLFFNGLEHFLSSLLWAFRISIITSALTVVLAHCSLPTLRYFTRS